MSSNGWNGRHGECEGQHAELSIKEAIEVVLEELF